jgi:hypothetical protein
VIRPNPTPNNMITIASVLLLIRRPIAGVLSSTKPVQAMLIAEPTFAVASIVVGIARIRDPAARDHSAFLEGNHCPHWDGLLGIDESQNNTFHFETVTQ